MCTFNILSIELSCLYICHHYQHTEYPGDFDLITTDPLSQQPTTTTILDPINGVNRTTDSRNSAMQIDPGESISKENMFIKCLGGSLE